MKPTKYKAKTLKGDTVTGWYVLLHQPIFDDQCHVIGHTEEHALFNDEPGVRSVNECYWKTIDPSTLEPMPEQLTLF